MPICIVGGAFIGAVIGGVVYYYTTPADQRTNSGFWMSVGTGALVGAVATIPGVGWGTLAAVGATAGAANYAGTKVLEHELNGKAMPSTPEFVGELLLSAGTGALAGLAGGKTPGRDIWRGFIKSKFYTPARVSTFRTTVTVSALQASVASFAATFGYQWADEDVKLVANDIYNALTSESEDEPDSGSFSGGHTTE